MLVFQLKPGSNPSVKLAEHMSMKQFQLDYLFESLNGSIMLIVDHFLYLNNMLLTLQKGHKLNDQDVYSMTKKINFMASLFDDESDQTNFITLKQSNRVLKQFHSLTTTLMILITSIKDL